MGRMTPIRTSEKSGGVSKRGNPRLGILNCIGELVKDGKYFVPRVILKEVVDQLHELFQMATQGVDKMLATFKARVTPKIADVNQSIKQHFVHCQANKPRNEAQVHRYRQEDC